LFGSRGAFIIMEKGISFIVPVYNVEKYLNRCVSSIVNQNDRRFELILVNDGSTDKSSDICKEWVDKYPFIHYVEQENKGLGPARMRGVEEAVFDYFSFVDADDWIENNFVQSMLKKVDNYDLVYCDTTYVDENEKFIKNAYFRSNLQYVKADIFKRMMYGYPNMWGCVYNKTIWEEYNIEIPPVIYEDSATYINILDAYKRIGCTSETKYVYRMGRTGSLMDKGRKNPELFIKALSELIEGAEKKNIFNKYKNEIEAFCVRQLENEWEKIINNISAYNTEDGNKLFSDFLDFHFSNWRKTYDLNLVAIGSYNVCAVYNRLKLFRHLQMYKYQFISLIDIFNGGVGTEHFCYRENVCNKYRKSMVEKIINKSFFQEVGKNSVILIDLLLECTDLIRIGSYYLTKSDALLDSIDLYGNIEIIPWWDDRRFMVWKNALDKFAQYVRDNKIEIIVIESYYAYEYGNEEDRKKYNNIETLKNKNTQLKKYYDYFKKNFPEAIWVSIDKHFYYTDERFSFGCIPAHLNEFAYYLFANRVAEVMIERNNEE